MGYNRSGERRKQRLKRHKREVERVVAKMVAAAEKSHGGAAEKSKEVVKGAVAKAGAPKATGH